VTLRRLARDVVVISLALALAVLLQVTIAWDLTLLGGAPDLVCIVLVSIALLRGAEVGALAGFAAGFLLDALSGQPLGLSSFVYSAVGYGAGRYGEKVADHAPLRPLLAVAVGTLVSRTGILAVGAMLGSSASVGEVLSIAVIPAAMIDVLLAIPLYPLVRRGLRRAPAPAALPPTTPLQSEQHVPAIHA
jgi:rod shape-determining protein MreD